jgi:hypothetical protein
MHAMDSVAIHSVSLMIVCKIQITERWAMVFAYSVDAHETNHVSCV